jgi:hypothetical protein
LLGLQLILTALWKCAELATGRCLASEHAIGRSSRADEAELPQRDRQTARDGAALTSLNMLTSDPRTHVRVDHRHPHLAMTEELLNRAHIGAVREPLVNQS